MRHVDSGSLSFTIMWAENRTVLFLFCLIREQNEISL